MTFVLITYNKIKANGFKGYLKSFAQPVAFILPLNIISEVAGYFVGAALQEEMGGAILFAVIAGFACVIYNMDNRE